ncbi:hypothetical protein FM120_31470 [Sphingobacterium faecium PCAi_F2.5]|nr:hypothetical protein FM120_31470 [Sphingobacterium faecium PCAi_F2.5]
MIYFSSDAKVFGIQIKESVGAADKDLTPTTLRSYIDNIEAQVISEIGKVTADKILADQMALPVMRRVIANWSLELYANSGVLRISDAGLHVAVAEKRLVASDKKILAFKRDCQELGCKALEELINIFEVRTAEFGEWRDSKERKQYFDTLFSCSSEFGPFGGVPISAALYRNIKRQIQFIQDDYLEDILGRVLLDELIGMSVVSLNASAKLKQLQRYAMRVVAPLAVSEAIIYRLVEIGVDGVYQKSIASSSDNIENQAVAQKLTLDGLRMKLISEGEANRVKLIKFLVENASEFTTAKVTQKSIYPIEQLNDDPSSNVYFM